MLQIRFIGIFGVGHAGRTGHKCAPRAEQIALFGLALYLEFCRQTPAAGGGCAGDVDNEVGIYFLAALQLYADNAPGFNYNPLCRRAIMKLGIALGSGIEIVVEFPALY